MTRSPVHPRSRGEHASTSAATYTRTGSSPLARGTPRGGGHLEGRVRFIPARAGNTAPRSPNGAPSTVHPRSRGEHGRPHPHVPRLRGSSPLARGTHHRPRGGRWLRRFIPARAGNTTVTQRRCRPWSVHPRSRGEHHNGQVRFAGHHGSSPLARGTHDSVVDLDTLTTFIPARAGNTHPPASRSPTSTVHPRSRGEHGKGMWAHGDSTGSSPLARGTPFKAFSHRYRVRFIPARAGNTRYVHVRVRAAPVHPRSRGEHAGTEGGGNVTYGSSPLARGTLPPERPAGQDRRFIPARAGNTNSPGDACMWWTVHPRSRGEHLRRQFGLAPDLGSSPLARGTPSSGLFRGAGLRFIPARAGNTPWPARSGSSKTVHPRSRGEHAGEDARRLATAGSSPLARGTRIERRPRLGEQRFIPARAGNT